MMPIWDALFWAQYFTGGLLCFSLFGIYFMREFDSQRCYETTGRIHRRCWLALFVCPIPFLNFIYFVVYMPDYLRQVEQAKNDHKEAEKQKAAARDKYDTDWCMFWQEYYARQAQFMKDFEEAIEDILSSDPPEDPMSKPKAALPYQEDPNGTVTHDGQQYFLNPLLVATARQPVVQVQVKDLSWIVSDELTEDDKQRMENADLKAPILVLPRGHQGKDVVIDGYHRLLRAIQEHKTWLPARIVTPAMMEEARIKDPAWRQW